MEHCKLHQRGERFMVLDEATELFDRLFRSIGGNIELTEQHKGGLEVGVKLDGLQQICLCMVEIPLREVNLVSDSPRLGELWVRIDLPLHPIHSRAELLLIKVEVHKPFECRQMVWRNSDRLLECRA